MGSISPSARDGNTSRVQYLLVHAEPGGWGTGAVLAEAGVLFVVGLWLLLRLDAPGTGLVRVLAARWQDSRRGGIPPPTDCSWSRSWH